MVVTVEIIGAESLEYLHNRNEVERLIRAQANRKPERLGSGLRTGLDWTGLDSASANAVPSLASAVLFIKQGLYIILNDHSFARKSQYGRLSL